jgi:hypothetical protein
MVGISLGSLRDELSNGAAGISGTHLLLESVAQQCVSEGPKSPVLHTGATLHWVSYTHYLIKRHILLPACQARAVEQCAVGGEQTAAG